MKTLTVCIGLILIVVNVLVGLIMKDFQTENVIASSCVLLVNAALLYALTDLKMKDGFKVSFFVLFPLFCLIEYVLAVLSPIRFHDNMYFVGIICCFAIQFILLFTGLSRN